MSTHTTSTKHYRARWAAIGAAIAVSLGAGGLGIVHATSPDGASAYVGTEPCRLLDTRPGAGLHIGPFGTLVPNGKITVEARGDIGECTGTKALPDNATGLQLNVTPIGATQATNLRVYPGDGNPPNASNLNPAPGQRPIPNAVTVQLDEDGLFSIYNQNGNVDIAVDVVGHYTDHHHDDRYYTKTQTDAALVGKANTADVYTKTEVDGAIADAGTTRTLSTGVATSLAPHECAFVFAFGVGGDSAAGQLVSGYILDASDNEVPSINNQTAFRPGTIFRTSQGGTIGYIEVCNLSATSKDLPAGWKVIPTTFS